MRELNKAREHLSIVSVVVSSIAGLVIASLLIWGAKINNQPLPTSTKRYAHLVGESMPPLALEDVDGMSTSPGERKPYIVFFSSASCKACDAVYPLLDETAKSVPVFMVASSRKGMAIKREERPFHYPILIDSLSTIRNALEITSVPLFHHNPGMSGVASHFQQVG